ncbi:hypothetical protein EV1_000298 [Malus domestica]
MVLPRGSRRGGAVRRLAWARSWLGMGRGGIVAGTTTLSCSTWLEPMAACMAGVTDCGAVAVLGESHGSCLFGLLDMTRARQVTERNEEVAGLMSYWNVGLNSPAG